MELSSLQSLKCQPTVLKGVDKKKKQVFSDKQNDLFHILMSFSHCVLSKKLYRRCQRYELDLTLSNIGVSSLTYPKDKHTHTHKPNGLPLESESKKTGKFGEFHCA